MKNRRWHGVLLGSADPDYLDGLQQYVSPLENSDLNIYFTDNSACGTAYNGYGTLPVAFDYQ